MLIRKISNHEISLAVEVMIDCWQNDYKGIVPPDTLNKEETIKNITEWINNQADDIRRMYGAFEGEVFCGFIGASLAEKEDSENGVEINYLFIKREYRGNNIGIKLLRTIVVEYKEYGVEDVIVYSWHNAKSNKFYRYLGGQLKKQIVQRPKGEEALVDIFMWDIISLKKLLHDKVYNLSFEKNGFAYNEKLNDDIYMTTSYTQEDTKEVCDGLYHHNVRKTNGLLINPDVTINLILKHNDKAIGAILCDTFSLSMYIDVMWIDDAYRGKGYGKALISQAEKIAKENGCIFSHTCTFSYQSPEFYKACGYTVFAELDDYPDGIVQYFLKKKL